MNAFADYILQRFAALEAQRPEWESAVDDLKANGLSRVNEVLQPIFDEAVAIGAELSTLRDELASPAWRTALIADVVADLVASGQFVKCGAGNEGLTLYSGAAPPDPATAQPSDLYVYVEPS
jgi:hypothetical protein